MKQSRLSESGDRGWFIGQFERAVFKTNACEVAYQFNHKGEKSSPHTHKIATEINLITSGCVSINGRLFTQGDIVIMEPNDICTCKYYEDTHTVVVKVPGVLNDKYLI
jgi:hypothetical protein